MTKKASSKPAAPAPKKAQPKPAPAQTRSAEAICEDIDAGTPVSRKEAEAVVRAVSRRCRGPISSEGAVLKRSALKNGDLESAKLIDSNERRSCGFDVNDIILANPLDGKAYAYQCPGCGLEDSYRAPRIMVKGSTP